MQTSITRFFCLLGIFALTLGLLPPVSAQSAPGVGSLVKGSGPTVYYLADDGGRYYFPNAKIFFSWYDNFDAVIQIEDNALATYPLKGNVNYKAGKRLIKIESDPKVYACDTGGRLRWIPSEEIAVQQFGPDWAKQVDDIPVSFFTDYQIVEPIGEGAGASYNPATAANETPTISTNIQKRNEYRGQQTSSGTTDTSSGSTGGTSSGSSGGSSGSSGGSSGSSGGSSAVCGNGIREGSEQCDGNDLNAESCSSRGFSSGTLSCSASCTFVTASCSNEEEEDETPGPDVTAPSVSWTSPSAGATVSGAITLTATASDNVGVASVKFQINNTLITTDSSSPYSTSYDTTNVSNGSYTLYAVAKDTSGNYATSTRIITVDNPEPGESTVSAALNVLTRVNGVSPETIYFSAQESTDSTCEDFSGGNDMEACRTGQYLGFHFDFDDPDSGTFSTTGNSKNSQVSGAPRALHTFVCEGAGNARWNSNTQQCEYTVGVRVQNPDGDYDDAFIQVNIKPQSVAYSTSNTYCISNDGDYTGCPDGVPAQNKLEDSPSIGSYSGKRVLFKRGTGTYSDVCIGYAEKNVRIGAFGSGDDPIIESVNVGRTTSCGDNIPTTAEAQSYPQITKDENGYITQGWSYDIGVSELRLGNISNGMAATMVTFHDLDMDWSSSGTYSGGVAIAANGQNCGVNETLDCSVVPYPYGIFLSEIRSYAHNSRTPLINFQCLTECALVNGGIIGSEAKTATEHTARLMGTWGFIVSNAWLKGNHIGGAGQKHKLTLRLIETDTTPSQTVNPENFVNGNHDGDGPGWVRESDHSRQFTPHYAFVIDTVFGDTSEDPESEDAAWIELRPGYRYSGLFKSTFIEMEGTNTNATQISLAGTNIVAMGTTYNGQNVTCRLASDPESDYYYDSDYIFSDNADGKCNGSPSRTLPVPNAPGT